MNKIINIEELRELLKQYKVKEMFLVSYIMLAVAGFELVLSVIISLFVEGGYQEVGVWFLISVAVMILLFLIFYLIGKRIDKKPYDNKIFRTYQEYEPKGMMVPLYRVVSSGKSSQTIYMIMDISGDDFEVFDIVRKGLKPLFQAKMSDVTFKFFYKEKRGVEVLKDKFQISSNGRKAKFQGIPEVLDRFIVFLKSEAYNIEIERK